MPIAAFVAILVGCASSGHLLDRPALESLPLNSPLRVSTLSDGDAWLRHYLVLGELDDAVEMLAPDGPEVVSDDVLYDLQAAIVLREAGEFGLSNRALERAEAEAEQRRVTSVSRTAGSWLLSEGLLSYVPSPGESAMIPYYRMMNHVALGDLEAAAVEARRISALLLDSDDEGVRQCREHGMLHYLAALVFEAAFESNDAMVSLRQADASFEHCPGGRASAPESLGADLLRLADILDFDEVADSAIARYPGLERGPAGAELGEVVVVLERGFVSHLTEAAIHVPIFEEEIEDLESGDKDGIAAAAATVTARLVNNFSELGQWGHSWDDHVGVQVAQALDGAHILKLAWPTVVDEGTMRRPSIRLRVGADTAEADPLGDISAVIARELEETRTAMLARLVTRVVAKYLISREVERKAEEEGGELLGFVTGRLANFAANESERADTRSWTLLPDEVALVRLTLPAGTRDVSIETLSPSGRRLKVIDLPQVEVAAGKITIVGARLWKEDDGENEPAIVLGRG
ncbi:MAG: hypothetical protein GEU90_14050 [Gemmatimonas sp.]|nr:hypothetical protein [Gemmatimonas sp.]